MIARALNHSGVEHFKAYLDAARGDNTQNPPTEMLDDERYTTELPVEIPVQARPFRSRLEVGAYLRVALDRLPVGELDSNPGLWSWLSLFLFDQLCPPRADGTRRPGVHRRHIADFQYRSRYAHLLYGPYLVYRRHGRLARVLLSSPPNHDSHFYQVITGVQDLIANRSVIEALSLLYLDPDTSGLKRGCQPSRPVPGTVRRFVRVLQQLDLTHDIYGMSGPEILAILPPEFDAWRPDAKRAVKARSGPVSQAGD